MHTIPTGQPPKLADQYRVTYINMDSTPCGFQFAGEFSRVFDSLNGVIRFVALAARSDGYSQNRKLQVTLPDGLPMKPGTLRSLVGHYWRKEAEATAARWDYYRRRRMGRNSRTPYKCYLKHFSTLNEQRQFYRDRDALAEAGIMIRTRRSKLTNPWDDYPRVFDRSWKRHRKTQWR